MIGCLFCTAHGTSQCYFVFDLKFVVRSTAALRVMCAVFRSGAHFLANHNSGELCKRTVWLKDTVGM